MPSFSRSPKEKLSTCHPDLQRLFNEIIAHRDCTVLEGFRDGEAQAKALAGGRSKAAFGESRHNYTPSLAVDVMPYPVNWDDMNAIREFSGFVLGMAAALNIPIKWGGHFKSFFDGPHYELIGNYPESRVPL